LVECRCRLLGTTAGVFLGAGLSLTLGDGRVHGGHRFRCARRLRCHNLFHRLRFRFGRRLGLGLDRIGLIFLGGRGFFDLFGDRHVFALADQLDIALSGQGAAARRQPDQVDERQNQHEGHDRQGHGEQQTAELAVRVFGQFPALPADHLSAHSDAPGDWVITASEMREKLASVQVAITRRIS